MQIRENNNSNEILIVAAVSAIEQMKYEIAQEFGVTIGLNSTARANGSVGEEITNLVRMAQEQLLGQHKIQYI
ncbi:alpha/beta-type small acid-soluble spore protein [Bacillus thuringiensis]|nr:alpha/beta-type small acid-soluble spore protein [Bacillus thuringiensis]